MSSNSVASMYLNHTRGSFHSQDTERGARSPSHSHPSSSTQGRENGALELDGRPSGSIVTFPDPTPIVPYWSAKRHLTCGNPVPPPTWASTTNAWRAAPGKLKTSYAALVLCLNIDVDPPDVVKTNPCAVLECWVDPHTMPSHKALEIIGQNLQHQFEGLSPKITYKPILDPSYDDLKRFCLTLRKQAKDDTVLFHYNGHGVPKPTLSGELWCFNKNYTQYIPVSIAEVQNWLGSPCVYIWDCSAAGNLLQSFINFAGRRDADINMTHGGYPDGMQSFMESIQLAACAANEQLPLCPELPADLFTSCLTSPIDIALRFFVMNHQLPNDITADMVMQLPGDLKDRRTPLGELNWIFTAITDTIAWTTFSRELFTRLYRSDLLIASLFRNFLLAERIMKNYHCTPHTYPSLPPTNTHPLWASWDLAVDACLRQIPEILRNSDPATVSGSLSVRARRQAQQAARQDKSVPPPTNPNPSTDKPYTYTFSRFFTDQLTAFEVWISRGGSALTKRGPLSLPIPSNGDHSCDPSTGEGEDVLSSDLDRNNGHHLVPRKPPDQLPIVLQVLLSQPHRLRALILLSQFVDLGPWAVHLALAIGIFPYISKLLQAAGQDLRPVLIFIWARILAVDSTCQQDLYANQGYKYFANVLAIREEPRHLIIPNGSEHKAMCAFILSAIARDFPHGQDACWRERVFDSCYDRLDEGDFLLRQWSALCIGQIWDNNDDIKVYGVDKGTQDKLIELLSDESPEVRAAALFALGTFMGASGSADKNKSGGGGSGTMSHLEERVHFRMEVAVATGATLAIKEDASPMVRKELLVVISCLAKEWRGYFVVCAWLYWEEERRRNMGGLRHPHHDEDIASQAVGDWLNTFKDDEEENSREENRVVLSSFFTIFSVLLELSVDPYQEVATNAQTVVDYVMALLLESPFTRLDGASFEDHPVGPSGTRTPQPRSRIHSLQSSPSLSQVSSSPVTARPTLHRSDTMTSSISVGVTNTLKRTSSFANAIRNLAFPQIDDGRSSPNHSLPSRPDLPDISRPPSPNLNFAQYTSPYSRPATPSSRSRDMHHSPTRSAKSSEHPPTDFLPFDVMEALMEEDMERLRARRRTGSNSRRHQHHSLQQHHHHSHHQNGTGAMSSPSGSTFSNDSNNSSVILGLGTGVGIRDVLPLKSRCYDWCLEYFKEPQMRQAENDEPGSVQYNYQVWRQQRNEKILAETRSQAEFAETCQWDRPVATVQITGHPLSMAFHAYDPHLVVANEADMISVWDWTRKKRLNYFYNGNPKGTSITSVHIINQEVGAMILTASAEGVIRLYRNYDPAFSSGPVQMVSSFRGMNEVLPTQRGSGVVTDWKQSGGTLLVSGDSRVIRVWDAHTENQILDIDTDSESPVTALASDQGPSTTFIASFGDGVVKVFDRRLEEDNAIVRSYGEHSSWVQNVHWHPTLGLQFLSASVDGDVMLWDLRGADIPVKTWNVGNGLSAFSVHDQARVFAGCTALSPSNWRSQRVVVHSLAQSTVLSRLNVPTGISTSPREFPSPFIPRHGSLVFHPTEMLYGVGSPDGSVRIMGCKLA